MTDSIRYEDVRRAVQEATANLDSNVNDVRTYLQNMQTDITRVTDVQTRIMNLEQAVSDIKVMVQRIETDVQNLKLNSHNS